VKGYVIVEVDLDDTDAPFRAPIDAIHAAGVPGATAMHVAAGDAGLRETLTRITGDRALRGLVSDWQANAGSRGLGDPTADTWTAAAQQLHNVLEGKDPTGW
jgi:hypothetical protein